MFLVLLLFVWFRVVSCFVVGVFRLLLMEGEVGCSLEVGESLVVLLFIVIGFDKGDGFRVCFVVLEEEF